MLKECVKEDSVRENEEVLMKEMSVGESGCVERMRDGRGSEGE